MKPTDSFACHPHRRCLYPTIARPYSNDDSIWLDFNSTGHCPREHIFGKPPFVRPLLSQQQAWTAPNTCPFPASSLWQVSADGLFLPIFSLCNFQQEQFSFRPLSSVSGEILQPDVWKWVDCFLSPEAPGDTNHKECGFPDLGGEREGVISKTTEGILATLLFCDSFSIVCCGALLHSPPTLLEVRPTRVTAQSV